MDIAGKQRRSVSQPPRARAKPVRQCDRSGGFAGDFQRQDVQGATPPTVGNQPAIAEFQQRRRHEHRIRRNHPGAQNPRRLTGYLGEGARIRWGNRPHQVVNTDR